MKYTIYILLYFTLLYLPQFLLASGNEQDLKKEFRFAYKQITQNPDSAYKELDRIFESAQKGTDTLIIVDCLQYMGEINFSKMNYAQSLRQYREALFFAEKAKLDLQTAHVLSKVGKVYNMLSKHDIGYSYLIKSHNMLVELAQNDKTKRNHLISSYQTMAGIEREKKNYRIALAYLDTCFFYANELNIEKINLGHLANEKAKNYLLLNQPDKALELLLPYEKHINNIIEESRTYTWSKALIILLQHNIAKAYVAKNNRKQALHYLDKALVSIENHDKHKGRTPLILELMADLQKQEGDLTNAYKNLKKASQLNKDYFNVESKINSEIIELKDAYKDELERKKQELTEQNLVVAEQEKSIYRFRAFLAFILLAISASFFIVRHYILKSKYNHQKELSRRKQEEQNVLIQYKQKELTSYSLQLIERDDLLDKFVDLITKKYQTKSSRKLLQARKQLSSINWEEFNKRFIEVNEGFYERLQSKYPELTPNDLKHCALIKINFSCKEMASILSISENSAQMARYRVRKKLGIPTEVNLNNFLAEV